VKQPYLEGMLTAEYFVLLSVLEDIDVKKLHCFVEVVPLDSTKHKVGQLCPISHYFSKRFYKF